MPPWAWVAAGVLWFAFLWTTILAVAAWAGGWRALARHYRGAAPPHTRWRRFRSGQFGSCNYGGCLALGVSAEGLSLALVPPVFPSHPPLFVPWADLSPRVVSGWLRDAMEFRFAQAPGVRLRIDVSLGRTLAADANRSWADDPGSVK